MLLRNEIKKLEKKGESTNFTTRSTTPRGFSSYKTKARPRFEKEYIPILFNLEDEDEYIQSQNNYKKINDYASINTTKDLSNLLRFMINEENDTNNKYESMRIESIQSVQSSVNRFNNENVNSQKKVEAYFEKRTKKKEEKLEKIKFENEKKQRKDLLYKPTLNKKTCELSEKMKGSMNVFERLTCGKDKRRKEENIKRILKQNSFTYKPVINNRSRSKDVKKEVVIRKEVKCNESNELNNEYEKEIKKTVQTYSDYKYYKDNNDYKADNRNNEENQFLNEDNEYNEYKQKHIKDVFQIKKEESISINTQKEKQEEISKIHDQSAFPVYNINSSNTLINKTSSFKPNDNFGLEELLKEDNYDFDMYLINKYKDSSEEILHEPLIKKNPIQSTVSKQKFLYKPQQTRSVNDRFANKVNAFSEKHPDKVNEFIAIRANLNEFYKEKMKKEGNNIESSERKETKERNIKGGCDGIGVNKMMNVNLNCLEEGSRRFIINNQLIKK